MAKDKRLKKAIKDANARIDSWSVEDLKNYAFDRLVDEFLLAANSGEDTSEVLFDIDQRLNENHYEYEGEPHV